MPNPKGVAVRESDLAMIATDRNARDQYMNTYRRSEFLEPEKALLMAVLQDAIDCYQKYGSARNRAGKEMLYEAEQWLMNDKDDWVFSFRNICDLLELDPQYIRRGLLEAKRQHGTGQQRHYKPRRQAA